MLRTSAASEVRRRTKYDHVAIPDADVPQAAEPVFRHAVATYAGKVNKAVGVWRAVSENRGAPHYGRGD